MTHGCTVRGMHRRWIAAALAVLLGLPLAAGAQSTPSGGEPQPLELRRDSAPPRPVVRPDPRGDQAARDAERAVTDYEQARRDDAMIREQSRPALRRPDLGYDVYGGIQQRNIPRR